MSLHEEGKGIKAREYRGKATYGKTRADVIIIRTQLCTGEQSEAEAATPSLRRGPIQSCSRQPCCKHHYFTPPSLSLLLLFCREDGSGPLSMQPFQAKKGDKKGKSCWRKERAELRGSEGKSAGATREPYSKTGEGKKRGTANVAKVCAVYRNAAWGPRRAKQRQHSQWLSLPSATTSAHH